MWAQAARAVAAAQQYPAPALYVVATPIGNLADLSLRSVHVLGLVDAVACEDTRHTAGLLRHLGLHRPLLAAHEHNERTAAETIIGRLARGERVAYVSDAGTPGVSDPGARLVHAVAVAGYRVIPVPGASSVVAALSVAGVEGGPATPAGFRFHGFLPSHGRKRSQALAQLAQDSATQVLFESPQRLADLLAGLAQHAAQRSVTVCRELTKQFEEVLTRPAAELPAWWTAHEAHGRGELVLVLHAQPVEAAVPEQAVPVAALLRELLPCLPLKQAVDITTRLSGAPRKSVYAQALSLRDGSDPPEPGDDAPSAP